MKLLFDHNLSPKLIARLRDLFPNSSHVYSLGLDRALDVEVWQFAADKGYTIATKDADYGEMVVLRGAPPKVVWIRRGNCSTSEIESLLRANATLIEQLDSNDVNILELF